MRYVWTRLIEWLNLQQEDSTESVEEQRTVSRSSRPRTRPPDRIYSVGTLAALYSDRDSAGHRAFYPLRRADNTLTALANIFHFLSAFFFYKNP